MKAAIAARMSTDKQSATAVPSDPRILAFCDALAEIVARSVLEDLAKLDDASRARQTPSRECRTPDQAGREEMKTKEGGAENRIAFSVREAARACGLSRDALRAAIRAGELPAARIGSRRLVVLASDLEAWIRRHTISPSADAHAVVEQVLARERANEAKRAAAARGGPRS